MHYYFEWSMSIVVKVNREHATDFTELVSDNRIWQFASLSGWSRSTNGWRFMGWTRVS